jgi:hypothetical protein
VVFYAPNQAVAVWSQSGLGTAPAPGSSLSDVLKMQHLAYALWDGSTWSSPQDLTTPTTGDGKVALAACPATDTNCPMGGEVTAAWVHNGDPTGALTPRNFRIQGATFANGVWSTPQRVDDGDEDSDTEPAVTYVGSQPLTVWVRDADRSAESVADRQIAMRFAGGAVQSPSGLPPGAVNPNLTEDGQGNVQMTFTVVDPSDRLVTNRRSLHRAVGNCNGTTSCTWSAQQVKDQANRAIFAEGPVVTVDANDKVTLTFRAMGFESPNPPPLAPQQEPIGVTQHTGELAQLELPSTLTGGGFMPGYLTLDGAVNWRAAAAYIPQLDTNVALAVKGQPPATESATRAAARSTAQRAAPVADDQPIIFADTLRLPNFVVTDAQIEGPGAAGKYTVAANILNAGVAWSGGGTTLAVEAYWDDSAWTGQPAGQASLSSLASGESTQVSMEVSAPALLPGDDHVLHIIANPGQPIEEATASDNAVILSVEGIQPPAQPRGYTVDGKRVVYLQWEVSDDPRVQGYRVYRAAPGEPWEASGTSPVGGWADSNVDWGTQYTYRVHSYGLALEESAAGEIMTLTAPAQPPPLVRDEGTVTYLPVMNRR